ncbi:MAG: cytochrome c biogenesis protein CcdA [Patescibacteria group bacterium]
MTLTLFIFSLTSAFLSGILALFAPCCITFLLPSYFASVFQRRKNIIIMTVIFFLGLATILLPISLGVAWLSSFFTGYHATIFIIGGSLLILYGVMAFFGKTVMVPLHFSPDLSKSRGAFGTYLLGIFSGIASSCCAPVLAGMLTLTALSASLPIALLIGLTYVLGMTLPLFILSLIWDGKRIGQSKLFKGVPVTVKLGSWRHVVHSTHLLVSAIFIAVGALVLYTSINGEAAIAAPWQTRISAIMQGSIRGFADQASRHPYISTLVYVVLILGWLWLIRKATTNPKEEDESIK